MVPGPLREHDPGRTVGDPEDGYHLMPDLADKANAWIRQQKALTPRPAVLHVLRPRRHHDRTTSPPSGPTSPRAHFAQGWNRLREETFARQKDLGVIPPAADLARRHDGDPGVGRHGGRLKPVLEREMEVYAGFLEFADPRRPGHRHARGARRPRRHLDLLHHRRQRRLRGGPINGCFNAAGMVNGPGLETTDYLL